MFLGHIAVGLMGKRARPDVSLGTWILSVQLADLIWPVFLLLGLEHVRIAPGITAFTPLDFYDYPLTHSLVAAFGWAALLAGILISRGTRGGAGVLLALGVVSHWVLDAISHRPDVPVLPRGPYVGLGLWNSVAATLIVELSMFGGALWLYARSHLPSSQRVSFWLLMTLLVAIYFAAAFGPPPPSVTALAGAGLGLWVLVAWAGWADRQQS